MTNEEVIAKLEDIQKDKIYEAMSDGDYANISIYGDVFSAAIEALQSPQAKQESAMCLAEHLAKSILQTAADIAKKELSDTRNYFKIYTDSEPSEIVEKISNLCGSCEKLIEIWNCLAEEIADYDEGDEVCDCISREEAITACQIGWSMDDWTRNHIAENIKRLPSVCKFLKTESEETTNE